MEAERLFAGIGEALTWFRLLYLDIPAEKWFVYFLGLLDRLKNTTVDEVLERLSVPGRVRERIRSGKGQVPGSPLCFLQ